MSLLLLIYLYMTLLKKLWLFRKKLLRVCLHVTLFSTFQQHPPDTQVSTCWKLYYLMAVSERKIITYRHWVIEIASHIGTEWKIYIYLHIYRFPCDLYLKIVLWSIAFPSGTLFALYLLSTKSLTNKKVQSSNLTL